MSKSKRARAAAKAAKRIPLVGTTVVLEPLVEAAGKSFTAGNITTKDSWMSFLRELKYNYAGVFPGSSNVDGGRLLRTYLPIGIYLLARKTGVSKPISRVLGRFGLRF